MVTTNVVIIGGGVIGLAAAAEISRHYDDVFLLLMAAVDLAHADERGLLGRLLGRLAGGTEAFYTATHVGA